MERHWSTDERARKIFKPNFLTKCEICNMVMQTEEPDPKIKSNQILFKIINSVYTKYDLKQFAENFTQLHPEERKIPLGLLNKFENLFDEIIGKWYTDTIYLDLNPYLKPFNSRYYPVTRINKYTLHKDIQRLVEIRLLTPVQQSQYMTLMFIISKKEGTVILITDHLKLNYKLVINPYC